MAFCCTGGARNTCCKGAKLALRGFIKEVPETGTTTGSVIPATDPALPIGRIPGTATPAETNASAG